MGVVTRGFASTFIRSWTFTLFPLQSKKDAETKPLCIPSYIAINTMLFDSNYVAPATKSDPRTVDIKHLLIILELFECDQGL